MRRGLRYANVLTYDAHNVFYWQHVAPVDLLLIFAGAAFSQSDDEEEFVRHVNQHSFASQQMGGKK